MRTETPYQDTREHLLTTGEAVIRGKGFAAVGLAEILGEAGVPKGSFYHYFKSKEAFGADMLVRYFERYDQQLEALLERPGATARACLLDYYARWARHEGGNCQQACLAVKLSGEVADLSEPMRTALAEGMQRVQARLAAAIRAGQADGSLSPQLAPDTLAAMLYTLWVGAELMAKVQRSSQPLQQALEQTAILLSPPTT
ncbi:MAG: TetR/AcrR family transcriptional regulator [Moraxellaceae bacterium]|nr:TetR/AcrR family transcriptional regulator [Moraxellaceae bacterium]